MKRTEIAFLFSDCIIAGLIAKMIPFEAKGFILFLCYFAIIIFIIFVLISAQLKFIEKEVN
jgi:hypothetical protein